MILDVMVSLPSLRVPHKEPEAPALPPCPGLLLVQESGRRKSPAPRTRLFPLANASFPRKVRALRGHITVTTVAIVGHPSRRNGNRSCGVAKGTLTASGSAHSSLCRGCTFESFRPIPPNSPHNIQHVGVPIDGATRQLLANCSGPHEDRVFTFWMWSEFCPSWRVDDQIVSDLELVSRNLCVRVHRRNPQALRLAWQW